jgi:hypothetical protein
MTPQRYQHLSALFDQAQPLAPATGISGRRLLARSTSGQDAPAVGDRRATRSLED